MAKAGDVPIEPQPRLRPDTTGTTATGDALVDALRDQAAAISELAAEIRLSRAEEAVTRQEMMRALAALAGGRGLPEPMTDWKKFALLIFGLVALAAVVLVYLVVKGGIDRML